jgi:hypothetical protein
MPYPSSIALSAAGPQSIAEVCTTSGIKKRWSGIGWQPSLLVCL